VSRQAFLGSRRSQMVHLPPPGRGATAGPRSNCRACATRGSSAVSDLPIAGRPRPATRPGGVSQPPRQRALLLKPRRRDLLRAAVRSGSCRCATPGGGRCTFCDRLGSQECLAGTRGSSIPQLRISTATGASGRGRLRVSVSNLSGIPQYGLPVYAIAIRNGPLCRRRPRLDRRARPGQQPAAGADAARAPRRSEL